MKIILRSKLNFILLLAVMLCPLDPIAAQNDPVWGPPQNLSDSDTQSYAPSLAVDPMGEVYVVWAEESGDGRSFISYSRFMGQRWSPANEIITSPLSENADYPTLAADSRGFLHLVWCGDGTLYYSQADSSLAYQAQGWSSPVALEYYQNFIGRPQLQIDAQDKLYLIYAIIYGDQSGIYLTRSTDYGQNWSDPSVVFRNDRLDRAVDLARLAAAPDSNLQAVWVESSYPETFPPLGIRYARSLDGGQTWSEPFALADGPYSYPAILWKPPAELHVVWSGTKPDRYKFHRWSDDGGLNWSETWRDVNIGGYQGLPALALDSSQAVHWLTVASVFSIQNDSLYHQVWRDGKWSGGEVVLRGEPVEQNGQDVVAAVVLGDVLVAANQVPIASDIQSQGWQYEIYALRLPLPTAHLQPVALVTSTPAMPNLAAIATPVAANAAETRLLPPGSLVMVPSQSPLVVIGIGVLAAIAVIGLLIFISLRQFRS